MITSPLTAALHASAEGICTLEAATGLIIAHGTWLARDDFARFIRHGAGTAAIEGSRDRRPRRGQAPQLGRGEADARLRAKGTPSLSTAAACVATSTVTWPPRDSTPRMS
jgi:hypothetical protein